jgi:hypothetical protein
MFSRFLLLTLLGLSLSVRAAPLPCLVSWIGNSFPGGDQGWVPQDVQDIFVTADGTVFTTVDWEEHRGNLAAFKDGKLLQQSAHWKSGGIDRVVGSSICATERHVFFATDKGRLLARRDRADIASRKPERKVEVGDEIRGVGTSADRVFAASIDGKVHVFDHELQPLGQWEAPSPGELCVDAQGRVWIIDTSARVVRCFDAQGRRLKPEIMNVEGVIPADVAITTDNRLLLADAGTNRQVRVYHHLDTTPELERTFGEKGGVFAGPKPGLFGDQRFITPVGVGADAQGNLYVASGPYGKTQGGTALIESYAPNGKLNWRVLSTEWLDTMAADREADASVLYGSKYRYTLDLHDGNAARWSVAALTLHPDKYPEDPRLTVGACGGVWHRRLHGKPFLFFPDMNGGNLFFYRFDPEHEGEIAVSCGQLSTKELWLDANGNGRRDVDEVTTHSSGETRGWFVDEQGSLWQATRSAGIFEYPLAGISDRGVPQYSIATRRSFPMPEPFTELRRIVYDSASDVMYLAGSTTVDAASHWKPMGPNLVRYEQWRQQRRVAWHLVMPHDAAGSKHESFEPFDFSVEGACVFVVYAGRLPSQNLPPGTVMIFDRNDKHLLGHLQPEGLRSGAVPMDALQDMVHSLNVHRCLNGEYLIFVEDDGYTKNLMYRWKP